MSAAISTASAQAALPYKAFGSGLKAGAVVIGNNGKPFTSASIGGAIATRAIMADLRAGGDIVGGPAPFARADRSRFLQALDEALVRLARG